MNFKKGGQTTLSMHLLFKSSHREKRKTGTNLSNQTLRSKRFRYSNKTTISELLLQPHFGSILLPRSEIGERSAKSNQMGRFSESSCKGIMEETPILSLEYFTTLSNSNPKEEKKKNFFMLISDSD